MVIFDKEGCNRGHGLSAGNNLGTPEPVCLAPDQKKVRPKKIANYLKITLAPYKNASLFL